MDPKAGAPSLGVLLSRDFIPIHPQFSNIHFFFTKLHFHFPPTRPTKELPSGRGGPPVWAADCPGSGFALLFPHFSFPSRRLIKSRRHPWPRPESVPVLHPLPNHRPPFSHC